MVEVVGAVHGGGDGNALAVSIGVAVLVVDEGGGVAGGSGGAGLEGAFVGCPDALLP